MHDGMIIASPSLRTCYDQHVYMCACDKLSKSQGLDL